MKTEIRACSQESDGEEVISAGVTDAEASFYGVYVVDESGNCLDLICDLETREKAESFEHGFQAGLSYAASCNAKGE